MEFLEHLEEWKIQAMDRANSVVAAKVSIWICSGVFTHRSTYLVIILYFFSKCLKAVRRLLASVNQLGVKFIFYVFQEFFTSMITSNFWGPGRDSRSAVKELPIKRYTRISLSSRGSNSVTSLRGTNPETTNNLSLTISPTFSSSLF